MEENMRKKKIAIINQRYGSEVNGGSEYYTKQLAEHLLPFYDVEVLTTTAKDYDTWKNFYPSGKTEVEGVSVLRFPVERERKKWRFRAAKILMLVLPAVLRKRGEYGWLLEQGPVCPELVTYIREHRADYDVFIFVTYLYYTTVLGSREVMDRAILVPTAHDEYSIYFDIYKRLFSGVKGIAYLTEEEEKFTEALFRNSDVPHVIAGTGIDESPVIETTKNESQVNFPYFIYVGRVDRGKGCEELFHFFERYKENCKTNVKLVVIGKMMIIPPKSEDIICLGFVSEEEKNGWMSNARALILPSKYESLSLVVLESMARGIPVLVNGKCSVLEGHCRRSGAGYSYKNYLGFAKGLSNLLNSEEEYQKMCQAGVNYVKTYYNWDNTVERYRELIEG